MRCAGSRNAMMLTGVCLVQCEFGTSTLLGSQPVFLFHRCPAQTIIGALEVLPVDWVLMCHVESGDMYEAILIGKLVPG